MWKGLLKCVRKERSGGAVFRSWVRSPLHLYPLVPPSGVLLLFYLKMKMTVMMMMMMMMVVVMMMVMMIMRVMMMMMMMLNGNCGCHNIN